MKRTMGLKQSKFLAVVLSCLLLLNTMTTQRVLAAATGMDSSNKSTVNPPQSIAGKTELATWSYGSTTAVTSAAPDFAATSGYYTKTPAGANSTLQLFRNNVKYTTGFGYSTSTISNNGYNGQTDKGYWLISTSTKGFKDLVFNFNTRSSGTGPRDFNTEWSTDGQNWTTFGNNYTTTTTINSNTVTITSTVKIETTSPVEQFGMMLPAAAANQDVLYIRIIQKSEVSEGNGTVASTGTHGVNSLQLYGAKDPLYTTPAVTSTLDTAKPILDVTPITLSCTDSNAQIYYTTDGTSPSTTVGGSTKLYSAPFTVLSEGGFNGTNPFVVKAVAKSGTLLPSDEVTLSFIPQTITSNADAKKLASGAYAWVKGIGTYLNGNTTLYIQDGMNVGSGLCIYKSGADLSSYVGKEIYVYGKASPYNGLMEIVPDVADTTNIVVRNASPIAPTPTKVMFDDLLTRDYEGMLVSVDTVKLVNIAGITTTSSYTHSVSQAGIPLKLRANGISSSVGTAGSFVNITRAIVNYNSSASYGGVYLLSTKTSDLEAAITPTVEFMTASVANRSSVPLNTKVTLATTTPNTTITYSLNGGAPVISTGNSADVTVDAFPGGKAIITATASDGTYTTAAQTFTYTQSKAANVSASPSGGAIFANSPITLSTTTEGASIVYSLYKNSYSSTDGTLVGAADQPYIDPITLDSSYFPMRIVAKAILPNYLDSDALTFNYTLKKAVGGEKNYYGSIHAHTAENSDGQGTLAEADAYARDEGGYDYFILTDHSNSYDKAPTTDSVATIGNLNNYNTTNQQWLNGKAAAADATRKNDNGEYTFLSDYGYEMTWSGGPGHINTFNTQGFVSRNNTILNNKTNDAGMQAYYQLLENTPGSISQFNHPGPTFGNFSNFAYYDPMIDDKINLIEVGNGEGAVLSGGYFRSIDQYILALDKGWHVAPTNNGDNHKKGWGTSNSCATVVYTNDFTMSGIYQAMRDRSVWATENRDLDVTYHLNDGTNTYSMGAILDTAPTSAAITVTAKNINPGTETSNIALIQLISNSGKVVNEQEYAAGNSDVTYTYSMTTPAAGYYFAKITDNQGFVAVTAPIWLGSAPKVGITSVANDTVMPVTTEAVNLTTTFFNNESKAATLKSISYTVIGDASASKSYDLGTSIPSLGSATHVFSYTPTTAGNKMVNINAVITVNGIDTTYTATNIMKVVDIDKVLYVGLDASHGNEYVSGGSYPDSMANMMTLAANNSLRVVKLTTSQDFINACNNPKYKMMILNAPSRKNVAAWPNPTNYTADEIAALKTFSENGNTLVFGTIADFAESSNADAATPKKHMSELQNDVLNAIGSTLREGDDEVMDEAKNGGQAYRLYPTEFNMANPLLQGVVSGQTYSQYSGSTIYVVDPITGERTSTLPNTVSPLVYGFPTTYSAECDNDNFGYGTAKDPFSFVNVTIGTSNYKTDKGMNNAEGLYIPKYVNPNSNVAANPEEKLLAASENVVHPNGKTSLVVVAGGSFMSNFEIQVALENAGTLPYANYNLMDNLYKYVNPVEITSIADAKNLPDGTDVVIEGTSTSEINTQSTNTDTNKGFFDCIYAQDSTGGINLFPVASGIKEGQKARFYGKITHYQGEVELTVSKFTILDENINKIAPTTLTSKDSMLPANTGLLVKTEGYVSNIQKDSDGTINQFTIDDGSGPAIVFINGYITKGTTLPFVKDGAYVSVTGLASIGEVVSDSDMHPRIRVRDRAEIVNIDKTAPVVTVTGVEDNKYYNHSVTPVVSIDNGTCYMTLNGHEYNGQAISEDGKYDLEIYATDEAYNTSYLKISFTIDTVSPTISVTGIENNGLYNHEVTPVVIVNDSEATVTKELKLNGQVVTFGKVDSEGTYTLKVTATDKAGNQTVTELSFVIDMTKPVITVTGVENNGLYNHEVTPAVSVNDSEATVTKELTLAGQTVPFGKVDQEGSYNLKVTATDKAGNQTVTELSFVIDMTKPVITVTGVENSGLYNHEVTPVVTVNDSEATVTKELKLNGQVVAFGKADSEGTYSLKVTAVDKAGNQTIAELSFVIDMTTPVITVTGVENDGLYNHEVTPVVTVNDSEATVTKELTLAGQTVPFGKVDQEGSYNLKVTATDKAGNKIETTVAFTIDKTAPVITVEGLEDGKTYTNTSITPNITIGEGVEPTTLTLDGKGYNGRDTIKSLGTHVLVIEAVDRAGNKSEKRITFTLDAAITTDTNSVIETIKDLVTNSNPEEKVVVSAQENPVIAAGIFDAVKGIDKPISFTVETQGMALTWTFNGKDVTDTNTSVDLRLNAVAPTKDTIVKIDSNAQIISFVNHGILPAPMVVTIPVDTAKFDVTKPLYFYYYNETTKKAELIADGIMAYKKGDAYFVDVTLTHNSDYFLSANNNAAISQNVEKLVQTGSPIDMNSLISLGVILAAIGCVIMFVRRRKLQ